MGPPMMLPPPKPIQPLGCALVGVPLTWAHLLPSSPDGWALPWTYPAIFFQLGISLDMGPPMMLPTLNLSSRWAAPWWEFFWPGPTSSFPVLMAEPTPEPIQPLGCALVGVLIALIPYTAIVWFKVSLKFSLLKWEHVSKVSKGKHIFEYH